MARSHTLPTPPNSISPALPTHGLKAQLQKAKLEPIDSDLDLHDHPDVVLLYDAPHLKDLFGVSAEAAVRIARGVMDWRRARTGMLTTNYAEAGGFIRSSAAESAPDLQLHFVIGKLVDHGRKTAVGHGYSSHVCLLQPRSRGRVALASADPMALPLVDPNFLADEDDL
ncbi:MAG: hypothetical protein E7L41_19425, partial [Escherichia coli]|nr:hypothetical protein [Escherichia coli]